MSNSTGAQQRAGGQGGRPSIYQRQSSMLHYHTFPTAPPRNPGRQPSKTDMKASNGSVEAPRSSHHRSSSEPHAHHETPLPKGQLAVLAVIALAEQTALNSISPYLPEMVASFPDVGAGQVGISVGTIASAFALAQFLTNFLWGWLSDRIGRKPVVLIGTFLTACGFVAFGTSRTLWQAVMAQAFMGLVNGNQGVISTCLGEITDRSNQSRAFTYLPVIYGLGGITGPIMGGLLVAHMNPFHPDRPNPYPYLAPNLLSAAILVMDLIITAIFLEESLESEHGVPPLGKRISSLFSRLWHSISSRSLTSHGSKKQTPDDNHHANEDSSLLAGSESSDSDSDHAEPTPQLFPEQSEGDSFSKSKIFTRDVVLLLGTFLIFQLSNISYNSLYPVFAQADPPTGRDLQPKEIGLSLAFAGVVTIVFQVGVFGALREKIGNKITWRTSLAGFVVAFLLMPFVGYKSNGKGWLWAELGFVLIIKTVAAVGGLTSSLLMITNAAPSHKVLGTLNGLAQTLSAAGRTVGPFISGSLFSAATHVQPKGEALAFGIFGGIALIGCLLSFGIRGNELEAEGWGEESGDEEEGDEGSEWGSESTERQH